MIDRRQALATVAGTLAAGTAMGVRAQAQPVYPGRAVTLMVPWPAGAPADATARRLQPLWQPLVGQAVIVDNLGGAGGTLGVARVMQQPADGHTVLLGTPTELVLSPQTIPAVRYKADDFVMVAQFGRVPYVLCGRPDLPHATLPDLLAAAAKASRPLTIGNIGPGSLIQLISLAFEKAAGITLTHVPYRGVPPMTQDLMSSQLDLAFVPLAGSTVATLEQGRLRPYGVSSARPAPLVPKLPALASQHPRLERFDHDVWGGIFVRRETPQPVLERLHRLWTDAVRDAEFLAWMRSTGSDPLPVLSLPDAQAFYVRETARYAALLREFPEAIGR